MFLEKTYENLWIEIFDGLYDSDRHRQLCAVSRLYNRLLGPVTAARLHRPELTDFSIYTSSCDHSPMNRIMPDLTVQSTAIHTMLIPAGGKGPGMLQPLLAGLGEMAERLLSVLHFEAVRDSLEWASLDDLVRRGLQASGPEEIPLFAPEQYSRTDLGFCPFRSDLRLRWIQGTDLLSGEPVWLPAQLGASLTTNRAAGEICRCVFHEWRPFGLSYRSSTGYLAWAL